MSRRQAQLELPKETAAPVSRETRPPLHTGPIADQILHRVPLDQVDPSPLNPRQNFDEAQLRELAASLAADGQLQPIVLRPIGAGADMRFSIVAGERRFRAAQLLGWRTIASVIRPELNEQAHARIAMIENLARTDLNPVEEARGYKQLLDLGMTQEEIADAVHRSRPAVANALRLLKAPEPVLAKLREGTLQPSHVLPLLRFEAFPEALIKIAEIAAENRTPSKQLEKPLDWRFTQQLREAKLTAEVGNAVFDWHKVCEKACPFGAFTTTETGYGGLCLKPEHFRQLQKEQRAKDKAKAEKALEKGADGKAPLKLSSLKYGQFERLYAQAPEGCTSACECRRSALDYGAQQVQVCVQPARYRQLQEQQRAREDERRKSRVADLAKRCREQLEAIDAVGSSELALLAVDALGQLGDGNSIDAILAKYAPGFKRRGKRDLDDLAMLEPLQLVKIAVDALIGNELADLQRYSRPVPYADWYAGPAPKPAKDKPSRRGRPRPLSADAEAAMTAIGAELHEFLQAPA